MAAGDHDDASGAARVVVLLAVADGHAGGDGDPLLDDHLPQPGSPAHVDAVEEDGAPPPRPLAPRALGRPPGPREPGGVDPPPARNQAPRRAIVPRHDPRRQP